VFFQALLDRFNTTNCPKLFISSMNRPMMATRLTAESEKVATHGTEDPQKEEERGEKSDEGGGRKEATYERRRE